MARTRRISDELPVAEERPEVPCAPTEAEWAALSEAERARVLKSLRDALDAEAMATLQRLGEGDPHTDGVAGVREVLRRFFRTTGRRTYVGSNLLVVYPGKRPITPDVLAAVDVEPHPRNSWLVYREGKGPDWVLEVHNQGDWRKDFVANVETYAGLGIPEYFIYDVGRQRLVGYRLPRRDADKYALIEPGPAGELGSAVLGLDLVVAHGRLRFYQGSARLLDGDDLLAELNARVAEIQDQREVERQRASEAEQRAGEAEQRVRVQILLGLLEARRIVLTPEQHAHITGCGDADQLDRWLRRAVLADTAEALLD